MRLIGGRSGRTDPEYGYEPSADFGWTVKAFELLNSGGLFASAFVADGSIASHVWGACPRCKHPLDDRQEHTALVSGVGRTGDTGHLPAGPPPAAVLKVDVACGCGRTHPGAPENTTGCGVAFRIELTLPQQAR